MSSLLTFATSKSSSYVIRHVAAGPLMNILEVMQQARQMQEQLQKRMSDLRVEASSGGGMVTVVVNGAKQLQSITIDPTVVSKDDVEMLQDLIVAAVNDAARKVDEQLGQSMSGLLGGLKIPGLS
jgi:hypothetical protein